MIQNNEIGVASDGKTVVGNGGDGILLDDAPQSQIGGTDQYQGNVIGGNHGNGINALDNSTGLLVEGNFIGTDPTATLNLAIARTASIWLPRRIRSAARSRGRPTRSTSTAAARSARASSSSGGSIDDEILSNSIYENAGLGINLGDGPTPNHAPGTPGPNDYQNYPTLSLAQSDGSTTTIKGTLDFHPDHRLSAPVLLELDRGSDRIRPGQNADRLGQRDDR